MTQLKPLNPADVARRIAKGKATLIDVREPHEYAREHIAGSVSVPLSTLGHAPLDVPAGQPVVFHCKSGMRTRMHCDRLAAQVSSKAYVLEGGLAAWKQAGLPVEGKGGGGVDARRMLFIAGAVLVAIAIANLLNGGG